MPSSVRAGVRLVSRVAIVGALAIGLLTAVPATQDVAHGVSATSERVGRSAPKVRRALAIARNQKGDPYGYGAAGPHRFDCSGLTYYSFRRAGFRRMPRTSSAQAHFARHIRRSRMRPGDLMFFYGAGGVYHVGVFDGFSHHHRMILHSPRPGTRVRSDRVWTSRWFAGTLRYR